MYCAIYTLYLLGVVSNAIPPLKLATGNLNFNVSLDALEAGPYVAHFTFNSLPSAQADLTLALESCGTVENYISPNSFLFHVSSDAESCVGGVASLPGVEGVAPLRPNLRVDPHLLPSSDLSGLRVISLILARGTSFSALSSDLQPSLTKLCPTCELLDVRPGEEAFVSSLGPNCTSPCGHLEIESPSECGCILPHNLVTSVLSSHPRVLWAWRVGGVEPFNAFGRGMMETTDLPNWGGVAAEYGSCTSDLCNHRGELPFSQIVAKYGALLPPFPSSPVDHLQQAVRNFTSLLPQGGKRDGEILDTQDHVRTLFIHTVQGSGCGRLPWHHHRRCFVVLSL